MRFYVFLFRKFIKLSVRSFLPFLNCVRKDAGRVYRKRSAEFRKITAELICERHRPELRKTFLDQFSECIGSQQSLCGTAFISVPVQVRMNSFHFPRIIFPTVSKKRFYSETADEEHIFAANITLEFPAVFPPRSISFRRAFFRRKNLKEFIVPAILFRHQCTGRAAQQELVQNLLLFFQLLIFFL